MESARERLLAFQTWDSWISDLLSITSLRGKQISSSPSPQVSPIKENRVVKKETKTSRLTPKTRNNCAHQTKISSTPSTPRPRRSRTPSKVKKRTLRAKSRSNSRKKRSKMLSAIHRITRDLETDAVESVEWNNCHASEVDSDSESINFLRISELRSESDDILPRPHVSPPIPPHKLGKRSLSQVFSVPPKFGTKPAKNSKTEVREIEKADVGDIEKERDIKENTDSEKEEEANEDNSEVPFQLPTVEPQVKAQRDDKCPSPAPSITIKRVRHCRCSGTSHNESFCIKTSDGSILCKIIPHLSQRCPRRESSRTRSISVDFRKCSRGNEERTTSIESTPRLIKHMTEIGNIAEFGKSISEREESFDIGKVFHREKMIEMEANAAKGEAVERTDIVEKEEANEKRETLEKEGNPEKEEGPEKEIIGKEENVVEEEPIEKEETVEKGGNVAEKETVEGGEILEKEENVAEEEAVGKGETLEKEESVAEEEVVGKGETLEKEENVAEEEAVEVVETVEKEENAEEVEILDKVETVEEEEAAEREETVENEEAVVNEEALKYEETVEETDTRKEESIEKAEIGNIDVNAEKEKVGETVEPFGNLLNMESHETLHYSPEEESIQLSKTDSEIGKRLSQRKSWETEEELWEKESVWRNKPSDQPSPSPKTQSRKLTIKKNKKRGKSLQVRRTRPGFTDESKEKQARRCRRRGTSQDDTDTCLVSEERSAKEDKIIHGKREKKNRRRRKRTHNYKSTTPQQCRKTPKSPGLVAEFGDERERLLGVPEFDVVIWRCVEKPMRVKKHMARSKKVAPAPRKVCGERGFETPLRLIKTIEWSDPVPVECMITPISPRHVSKCRKRSPRSCSRRRCNTNNNSVDNQWDVNLTYNSIPEMTGRKTKVAMGTRKERDSPYPYPGAPRLRRSCGTSELMEDASNFSWYPSAPIDYATATETFSPIFWSNSTTCIPSESKRKQRTDHIRTECKIPKVRKSAVRKRCKLKVTRVLRRISSFKDQLDHYTSTCEWGRASALLQQINDNYGFNLLDYIQYLRVLRNRNNVWSPIIQELTKWTPQMTGEFAEFVCYLSIDTANIDDIVLPFRVSIKRHKILSQVYAAYRRSLPKSKGDKGDTRADATGDNRSDLENWNFSPLLWIEMCDLPLNHPIREILRQQSGLQDRRLFAIENEFQGRILLAENKVVFVRGVPCFLVHIMAPSNTAIGYALMRLEESLPSIYTRLIITERLPKVYKGRGDRAVHAPTKGNFTTCFGPSPRLSSRATTVHAPLSAEPVDRRDFASYCRGKCDQELEQVNIFQKFIKTLCKC